jgi:hypothetical protein
VFEKNKKIKIKIKKIEIKIKKLKLKNTKGWVGTFVFIFVKSQKNRLL